MICVTIDNPSIMHDASLFLLGKRLNWNLGIFTSCWMLGWITTIAGGHLKTIASAGLLLAWHWRTNGYNVTFAFLRKERPRYVELHWIPSVSPQESRVEKEERLDRFMENFQTEVLEIEFTEFSHGFKTISDLDFAELLLRYTDFDRDTKKTILKKVKKTTNQPNVWPKETSHPL